jgi:hypothetical protein
VKAPSDWRGGACVSMRLEAMREWSSEDRDVGIYTWRHLIGALKRQLCHIIV